MWNRAPDDFSPCLVECFAILANAQEDHQRATQLFGAAELLRENANLVMNPMERMEYDRELSYLRKQMEEKSFLKAWADGRALTM